MDVALCTEKVSKVNVDLYSASSWSTTSNALTFSRKSALISDSQASANTAKSFKQTQCCCRNNEMFACQQLQHVFECCLSSLTHNTCSNAVCRHWHTTRVRMLSVVTDTQHVFECCLSSLTHNTCSNAVCRHWHSPTIVLSLVCCPVDDTLFKVGQKSAVQMCQVAAVVMVTTQLVLSHLKTFYHSQWRTEWGISVPKIISECFELMKLCDVNCRSPFFWDTPQRHI